MATVNIRARISSITVNNGQAIQPRSVGVTCLVGSNNVGKSQTLRNIHSRLRENDAQTYEFAVVTDVQLDLQYDQSEAALDAWLTMRGLKQLDSPPGQPAYMRPDGHGAYTSLSEWRGWLDRTARFGLRNICDMFVWYASPGSLVHAVSNAVGDPTIMSRPMYQPNSPTIAIAQDGSLEGQLSNLSLETFGVELTLDRVSSDKRFRIGAPDPSIAVPFINRPDPVYAAAVGSLPKLETQGDGIKSFLGLAAHVLAGGSQILLIDEPDTFLHPSQARTLGRWLAEKAVELDLQVIVSTHDKDFVLGLLSAGDEPAVDVIRVTRDDDTNTLKHLTSDRITEIWRDPFLRYSNTLQGLFHQRVVVCEGDGDCRFYAATLDVIAEREDIKSISNDTLFVPCGGKDKAPTVLRALTELGVQATAVLDFDALNTKGLLKKLLRAVGREWNEDLDGLYTTTIRHINALPGEAEAKWKPFKAAGASLLPAGNVYNSCVELLSRLDEMGIVILTIGELEGVDKTISLHGPAWVSQALLNNAHKTSTEAARIVKKAIMHTTAVAR